MLYLIPLLWFTHGITAECTYGRYGYNCSRNCSTSCQPLLNGNIHCNETTGECSEGCIAGFYTPFCNETCEHCHQRVCDFVDGSCSLNCENKPCENKPCDIKPCVQNPEETWKIISATALSLIGVVIVFVIGIFVFRRRRGRSRNADNCNRQNKASKQLLPNAKSVIPFLAVAVPASVCHQCYQHKCDDNKICLNGCIPGFAGVKCSSKCPPNCIDSICDYDGKTGSYPCSIGCIPGYHGLQCNTPCEGIVESGKCDRYSGTFPDCGGRGYGENCEISCEPNCGGIVCDNKGNCIEAFCVSGRFGTGCNKDCQAGCEKCHRDTGKCLKLYSDKDLRNCPKCSCDNHGTVLAKDDTGYSIGIIVILCFILCSWTFYFYKKYFRNRILKSLGKDRNFSNVTTAKNKRNPTDTRSDEQEERLSGDSERQLLLSIHEERKNSTAKPGNQEFRRRRVLSESDAHS